MDIYTGGGDLCCVTHAFDVCPIEDGEVDEGSQCVKKEILRENALGASRCESR